MKKIAVFCFLLMTPFMLRAQYGETDPTGTLEKLFSRLPAAHNDSERIGMNDSIISFMDLYANSDSSFYHRFTGIKNLGQIKPPSSRLKIITWNLPLRDVPGKYFCYFIREGEKNERNRVTKISADYRTSAPMSDTTIAPPDWYGALYYDFRQYKDHSGSYWILLGIDFGDPEITRKVIEVLRFDADNAIFGKRIFNTGKEIKYREVFEYASNGAMSLRFKNDDMIVFDHLVPIYGSKYYGSDYSFDAYHLRKTGFWQFETNVDVRNSR